MPPSSSFINADKANSSVNLIVVRLVPGWYDMSMHKTVSGQPW